MIECLQLFWMFFKIGLFTFGGGYAMIPLIKSETVLTGMLTEAEFMNYIGISESTPGPIAINMATFVGSSQFGFLGSVCATLGVVTPAFLIIILIASILKNFEDNKWFNGAVKGVTPVINGLLISTGVLMAIECIYVNFGNFTVAPSIDIVALCVTAFLILIRVIWALVFKKKMSAIVFIIFSAVTGIVVF